MKYIRVVYSASTTRTLVNPELGIQVSNASDSLQQNDVYMRQ